MQRLELWSSKKAFAILKYESSYQTGALQAASLIKYVFAIAQAAHTFRSRQALFGRGELSCSVKGSIHVASCIPTGTTAVYNSGVQFAPPIAQVYLPG